MAAHLETLTDWILDSIDSGLMVLDLTSHVLFLNKEGERLLGLEHEKIEGSSILEVPRLQPLVLLVNEHRKEGPSHTHSRRRVPAEIENAEGERIPMRIVVSNLMDMFGTVQGYVVSFRDLSEMVHLETRTRRVEHLAALGTVAAGVAHEVRNPLHAIHSVMELVEIKAERGEAFDEYVQMVYEEISILQRLMEDILNFSREITLETGDVDLADLVESTAEMLNLPDEIRLATDIEQGLPVVDADRDRLRQVLRNLIRNAVEAMPEEGGTITLSARKGPRRPLPTADASVPIDFLELAVADDGPGIPEEDVPRLFEPFFTKRRKGTGSGLGLGICQRIVVAHDGYMEVETEVGEGTTFLILLPLKIGAEGK